MVDNTAREAVDRLFVCVCMCVCECVLVTLSSSQVVIVTTVTSMLFDPYALSLSFPCHIAGHFCRLSWRCAGASAFVYVCVHVQCDDMHVSTSTYSNDVMFDMRMCVMQH